MNSVGMLSKSLSKKAGSMKTFEIVTVGFESPIN